MAMKLFANSPFLLVLLVATAFGLLAEVVPVYAQTTTTDSVPTTTLSVNVKVVTLPVTVRDKKGNIVTNLTKDDFALLEDARPQTVKYLDLNTDLPLTLGLLMDTSLSMRTVLDREKISSKSFINQMLVKQEDQAFLIHFDREAELLQDLTNSKDKLASALDALAPPQRQTVLYDAVFLASNELMRKQHGRKALVLLSDGEDHGSKETVRSAIEAAQRADTIVYTIYWEHEHYYRGGGGRPNVSMGGGWPFPGGGGGYPGGGGRRQPQVDGKKIMKQIAQETGGRMYEAKQQENFDQIYLSITEELRSQYTLGYTPDNSSADESYHKITLTAKRKKGLYVRTREGYYADNK